MWAAGHGPQPVVSRAGIHRGPFVVLVVALAICVLGLALVSATVLRASSDDPCASATGSTAAGFDDTVGPVDFDHLPLQVQFPIEGTEECMYHTPIAQGRLGSPTAVGSVVSFHRIPREGLNANTQEFGNYMQEWSTALESSNAYPFELFGSGVVAVGSADGSRGSSMAAWCENDDFYWKVGVLSIGRDDSEALDALLVSMDCRPVDI